MLYKEKPSSNKQYAKQNKNCCDIFFFQTGKVLLIPASLSMVGAING